jgi:hypothetical protein
MIENLEVVKEKLVEFLSFANVTREEIDNLFKVAVSTDCEAMRVSWRKNPYYVRFDVGILWDENIHQKSKILTVRVKIGNTMIIKGLEHTEGKFQTFIAEFKLV